MESENQQLATAPMSSRRAVEAAIARSKQDKGKRWVDLISQVPEPSCEPEDSQEAGQAPSHADE